MSIWVCGEVLIDLLPHGAVVGGGPANTAKALALLGHDVQFIDGLSRDAYGVTAREELIADGVGLTFALDSEKPMCTAAVTLDENSSASYVFTIDGTATFDFNASWLPDPSRHKPQLLHIGTLATIVEPGSLALYDWALQVAEFAPIVFDPNIRSSVLSDRDMYEAVVEKWVAISTVVKVSDDDLAWLFPGVDYLEIAKRWVNDGVAIVFVTRGADGIAAVTENKVTQVAGVKVDVIDTVGAGDTVGAIVCEALIEQGVLNLRGEAMRKVLERAVVAAGITCSRAGAKPPTQRELAQALKGRK